MTKFNEKLRFLATQDILTYCTNRPLPYHLYADEGGLLVFGASLTSGSLSKITFWQAARELALPGFCYPIRSSGIQTRVASRMT